MTVIQNDRLFQGNGFQRWCDALGITVKLNSKYWTEKKAKVDTASEVIVQYQQEKFRKAIIRASGGECVGTIDGTYGTRGFKSRDCFVSILSINVF